MRAATLILAVLAPFAAEGQTAEPVADLPLAVESILQQRRVDCTSFGAGTLVVKTGAIRQHDLDGDGQPNWIVDERFLDCSDGAALFCGSGGCMAHFVVQNSVSTALVHAYSIDDSEVPPKILLETDGGNCVDAGPDYCLQTLVWDRQAGNFITLPAANR